MRQRNLLAFHVESEFLVLFALTDKDISGLAGKRLEIANGPGISCLHPQDLTTGHLGQGFLGLQDGKRTIQAARIQVFIEIHVRRSSREKAGGKILP